MDIEKLIESVTERVITKLNAENRIVIRKPKGPINSAAAELFDKLIKGTPIAVPTRQGAECLVLTAITKLQLGRLLAYRGVQGMRAATMTAMLKARGVTPFRSKFSTDTRHRFYIDGEQTQCYVFSEQPVTEAWLLEELSKLKDTCPELSGNFE